jgi:hypothetical protein
MMLLYLYSELHMNTPRERRNALEDVDFSVEVTAALNQIVLLAHDETISKVLLFNAFDLHAHIVARFGDVDLIDKKVNTKQVLRYRRSAGPLEYR